MTGLPRATRIERGPAAASAADVVRLDHDMRHRRRVALTTEGGLEFLLDLTTATVLRDGDVLRLDDGRGVTVRAAPEPLAEIRTAAPGRLVRIAWHLGNRHLPVMIEADRLLIRRDHVIEDMVRGQGGHVAHIEAPFDPEGGAYDRGGHGHRHHHD